LLNSDKPFAVVALYQFRRCMTRYDLDCGNRQEHLLANHLTQAAGGSANAHIGDLGKCILLNFG
jgi:hypothetical protein